MIIIDASHGKDASIHSTNYTHLWQYQHMSNQIALPANVGEREGSQTQESEGESDDDLSSTDEDGTICEAEGHQNLETECLDSFVNRCFERNESELEEEQGQVLQDGITTAYPTSSVEELLTDEVICDVLSSYPFSPKGDLRSFLRIIQALIFSFSPLSPSTLAGLLGFKDAQHLKRILLPASPLIFTAGSNKEADDDRTPVRFMESSIVDFFLDRTRSGRYYVDGSTAHRVLLDGCTSVMEVYGKGVRLDMVGWGLRDAYKYACQNWERHRRAGTKSKL